MVAFPFPHEEHSVFLKKQMFLKSSEEDPEAFMLSSSHCACKKNPELFKTWF